VDAPAENSHIFIYYDAPVLPAQARTLRRKIMPPSWAALNNELTVQYQTVIPRTIKSYHVTVSVPEEIRIRRLFMTTDVDSSAVQALIADMVAVAKEYRNLEAASQRLLEQELQSIASRLAELGRRRMRDLELFKTYLRGCYSLFSQRHPRFRMPIRRGGPTKALRRLASASRLVSHLARFAELYETSRFQDLSKDCLDKKTLERLVGRLPIFDLDKDLNIDNDPREHSGHVHWDRRSFGPGPQSVEPINARVYLELVDDPPSLASSVSRLLVAVFALVLGVTHFLQPMLLRDMFALEVGKYVSEYHQLTAPSAQAPLTSADAVVTVLLLVPGLMLSRLDLPSHKTVLGRLRSFPRYVAYISVIVPSCLAVVVATLPKDRISLPFAAAIGVLMLLVLLMVIDKAIKVLRRRSRVPRRRPTPRWLLPEMMMVPGFRMRRSAVKFSTVEGESHE
jgi:hypothetical protein